MTDKMPVTIILGMPYYRLMEERYPETNFAHLMGRSLHHGITFYGDKYMAPLMTGSGLDFTRCDEIVPEVLRNWPEMLHFIPCPSYDRDRFPEIHAYWYAKGWLDKGRWAVFDCELMDEPRGKSLDYSNRAYGFVKRNYPKLEVLVTDHRMPLVHERSRINRPGYLDGDITIPMMVLHEGERRLYGPEALRKGYRKTAFGMYTSGSFPEFADNPHYIPFEPAYYRNLMPEGVDVPNPAHNPHLIKQHVRDRAADLGKTEAFWLYYAAPLMLIAGEKPGTCMERPAFKAIRTEEPMDAEATD